MGLFDTVFKRHSELSWMYDLEFLQDKSKKAYLKQIALNTVIEMVARTISQSEFRVMTGNKREKDDLHYKLNVQPNKNQNAVDFWQKFIYKLIIDNEVLVVKNDDGYFFVADDFVKDDDMGLYPHKFINVMVNNFEFKRFFSMDDVIYLTYSNQKLEDFSIGLFEDYGEIFGRMIDLQLMNNQVRGVLNIDTTQFKAEDGRAKLQGYIDMMFEAFKNNSIAIAPLTKGLEYEEHSSKGASQGTQEFKELEELKRTILTDIARMIGVPPSLVIGEMADLEKQIDSYLKFCINPLLRKIESELNSKFFYEQEYLNEDKHIKVVGIDKRDPLQMSESIDKLVSSGTFTRNQVRIMTGEDPADDPELDKFIITKNLQTADAFKGGETNASGQE
ncbi:phage portal protein [Staphylococcus pasteuri]|nr:MULTISPECIES: phage portal protein [Staphylococcus]ODB42687.1 phage portal protein [Staphylococcus sp. AOAB]RQX27073.1 phage portal protein [Staphylococcus warneri]MBM6506690.1 phage portal protein [Staphylococcus pasteuri]MCO0861855.1 phage portal protein [Staphylococcus pasteuri]MCO5360680.1 phage portal protein [Staphylococcus pasteuri]